MSSRGGRLPSGKRHKAVLLLQVAGPEVGGAGASCALIIVLCRGSWWVMWSFGETPDRPCGPPLPFRTGFTHRDEKVWGNWLSVNPFADDAGSCFVGVNGEEQHSLLPGLADVVAGWRVVCGEADRAAGVDCIEQNWTDVGLKSLRERTGSGLGF